MTRFCLVTVDVDPPLPSCPNLKAEDGLDNLLEIFNKHKIKATFFVTATLCKNLKRFIQKIAEEGHEIGCHGLEHDPQEINLSIRSQIKRLALATNLIEETVGSRPLGFRAPLFKINRKCLVALHKNEYLYDSSIVCSPFYNPHKIFFPSKPFLLIDSDGKPLIEIPVSVNPVLPFPLGGAYGRIFGSRWLRVGIKMNFLIGAPVTLYIHPRDVSRKTRGYFWYTNINTTNSINIINNALSYAKRMGAKFLKAQELAELFLKVKDSSRRVSIF